MNTRRIQAMSAACALACVEVAAVWAQGTPVGAGRAVPMPSEAVRLHGTLMQKVQPSVRSWIDQEARKLATAGPQSIPDAAAIRAQVRSRLAGQSFADMDVEALAAMVMTECAAAAKRETEDLLEQMKKVNAAKEKLRALAVEAKKQVDQTAGMKSTERCVAPVCGGLQAGAREAALAMREARMGFNPPDKIDDIGQLRAFNGDLKARLDSLNGTGDAGSLRLQLAMERYAKFSATLGDLMKKISGTADPLVQNLK